MFHFYLVSFCLKDIRSLEVNEKSVVFTDDIWVVSKTLNFDSLDTFIASSAFFGPTHNNEVELLPLKGYYPSNWHSHSKFYSK